MARAKNVHKIPEPTYVEPEEEKPSQAENIISIVLGLAVVLVIGAMIINAIRGRQNQQTATTQPETTQEASASGTHTVVAGETLWSIAEDKYNDGYKWVEIQKANNMSSGDAVEVGDTIIIPTLETTSPSPVVETAISPNPTDVVVATATAAPAQDTGSTGPTGGTESQEGQTLSSSTESTQYTVKKGDTLWAIAQARYNDPYKWVEIARANNLANPDLIYEGTTFTLP